MPKLSPTAEDSVGQAVGWEGGSPVRHKENHGGGNRGVRQSFVHQEPQPSHFRIVNFFPFLKIHFKHNLLWAVFPNQPYRIKPAQ